MISFPIFYAEKQIIPILGLYESGQVIIYKNAYILSNLLYFWKVKLSQINVAFSAGRIPHVGRVQFSVYDTK